jgi:hypothetical protein
LIAFQLPTPGTINPFNLFFAAMASKFIELLRSNGKHPGKVIWFHPAKTGPIFVNLAEAIAMVVINAPTVCPH